MELMAMCVCLTDPLNIQGRYGERLAHVYSGTLVLFHVTI